MHTDRLLQLGLRVTQCVSAIIILSLCSFSSYTSSVVLFGLMKFKVDQWTLKSPSYGRHAASPIGFLIFTSVFSLISGAYLQFAPSVLPRNLQRYAPLLLISLNALFYICGFIALAVYLSNLSYCRGAVCDSAKASCFFAAFSYLAWIAEAVLVGLAIIRNQRGVPLPLKDDYEDQDEREEPVENFKRKDIGSGEKLSDVKL
ncbi:MARVEL domain-containing protein [Blumeria hordei DH14]|uniref:MARVEL domain-containing protein n=1 Tax=Blumeria graminis f. sp. hordei (strain DH14) TaxID=546991 RepID=N1JGT6_BLUG1|nr:MARVEL domain-containing protein [Blumeria hordei DH14]